MPDDHALAEEAAAFIPAAPDSDAARLDWLRLARSRRVGPATFRRLMLEHGTARASLDALPAVARAAGVNNYTPCPVRDAEQELAAAGRIGARMLCLGAADYPRRLTETPDGPALLWSLGHAALAARPGVALVGARNASAIGQRMARRLASGCGKLGLAVTSGLARGIDAAAHEAALETGTIAIMAGGLDVIYPKENGELARSIGEAGLLLSEMPFGLQPLARHFPQRNRLVAGLADAVVVVEGAARSGSLITARNALDYGRDVMAVPGNPLDARSAGCNALIRDGAVLVRNAEDIAEALRSAGGFVPQRPASRGADETERSPEENNSEKPDDNDLSHRLLSLLSTAPVSEDTLTRELRAAAAEVARSILDLELQGKVERHAGGQISLRAG